LDDPLIASTGVTDGGVRRPSVSRAMQSMGAQDDYSRGFWLTRAEAIRIVEEERG
jgi:hypothetical protein